MNVLTLNVLSLHCNAFRHACRQWAVENKFVQKVFPVTCSTHVFTKNESRIFTNFHGLLTLSDYVWRKMNIDKKSLKTDL